MPGWHVLPAWTDAAAITVARPLSTEQAAQTSSATHFAGEQHADSRGRYGNSAIRLADRSHRGPRAPPVAPAATTPATAISLSWQSIVLLVWLAGSAILLAQIVLGFLSLAWLRHRSSRMTTGNVLTAVREIAMELGIRRPMELITSSRRAMPMIWGLWRIRVLLPAEAAGWSPEQCRVVLFHELAHARRFDCLTQLVAQLVCACFGSTHLYGSPAVG